MIKEVKKRRQQKMKIICSNCNAELEIVKPETKPKGMLNGIALLDMTLEQLRIEKRNAKSVLYKSEKAGASEEMLAPKRERVAAVEARIMEIAPVAVPKVTAVVQTTLAADSTTAEEPVEENKKDTEKED